MLKVNDKAVSLMLFLVYLLLTLNITLTFFLVFIVWSVSKYFFRLSMTTIMAATINICVNATVIMTMVYDYDHVMK